MNPKRCTWSPRIASWAALAALALVLPSGSALGQESYFRRGDSNGDSRFDIADPISTLNFLFLGGPDNSCRDAADSDDSGEIDLTDAMWMIWYLFLGGETPEPPFLACGIDPTPDDLTCEAHASCPLTLFTDFLGEVLTDASDDQGPMALEDLNFTFSEDPEAFEPLLR